MSSFSNTKKMFNDLMTNKKASSFLKRLCSVARTRPLSNLFKEDLVRIAGLQNELAIQFAKV